MNKTNFDSKDSRNITKDTLIVRLLSVVCLVGGFQVATQYFAQQFNYQSQLGAHFFNIYEPWAILLWANKWYGEFSDIFDLAAGFGILFSSIGLILVLVIKMVLANSSRANQGLHGSARWANKQDIVAAGLLSTGKNSKSNQSDAVYVGGWRDNSGKTHYLKHSGPEHVLCYAPTRSGKGVSLVIPTLLSWTQSAVITDLKGELWALTSGWRQHHAKNKVLRFDPASTSSAHWNPLDEILIGSGTEVADVQNLTTLIVDPDGKGLQTHWQKTSQALLVGVILHVLYKSQREGTPATLSTVDSMLSDPDRDISVDTGLKL
ncbi:MAG: type IV secretory system conjugative DNA transfer family protein, partial [Proteobacteria bacterium]|nr:type IV secretory system conjugative DNA transfer family protein [Pseudomonadota bacterium]